MPGKARSKLKTKKGAVKRFKKTANGYRHRQSHRNHISTKKSSSRMRGLRPTQEVKKCDEASVKQQLNH